ncbi:hypothetical protein WICMUC_004203 [Wickerhamomyces mucosus]|uniref:Glycoside hydrolase family 5 domain-containing protein n=1 Tax=Wickerhamomyces mucosus TaxID=1378264 RepID=A0A9P8PJI1_9ASCO|nr:hypothetical protein WICMUC_004203 [Wickerhamomyces mucosus]
MKLLTTNLIISIILVSIDKLTLASNLTDDLQTIWDYNGDTIKGISLGGWFVLEPYITPSLFEQFDQNDTDFILPVDEYSFCTKLGQEDCLKQLESHWDLYYTEDDFIDIKNYGFNTIRIPIGYWAFFKLDNDPYVQGQIKYLDRAIDWARLQDLKVWIDLHGLPGSQNGFDNSGQRGNVSWFDNEENLNITFKTLNYIFAKYGGGNYTDVIIGIEIANEPLAPKLNISDLLDFIYNSYYDYREIHQSTNYFVVQEAFESIGWWNDQLNNDYTNVSNKFSDRIPNLEISNDYFQGIIFDHHHYEVFTYDQLNKTFQERIQDIIEYSESINEIQKYHPSLVGEWSGAITDCAKWLNGVGTGARYDYTFNESQFTRSNDTIEIPGFNLTLEKGVVPIIKDQDSSRSCSNFLNYDDFPIEHKEKIRKFIEIQLIEYAKNSAGWIFWNYKTENAIEWDFKELTAKGLFPSPLDNYTYFYPDGSTIKNGIENSTSIGKNRRKQNVAIKRFKINNGLLFGSILFGCVVLFY